MSTTDKGQSFWKPEAPYIDLKETNRLLHDASTNFFQRLTIDMSEVKAFDPVFLGWLFLLKQGGLENKTIELSFGENPQKEEARRKVFWQVNQMVFYLSLFKENWIRLNPSGTYARKRLEVVSSDFFPPIFISEKAGYELMFNHEFWSILKEFKDKKNIKDAFLNNLKEKKKGKVLQERIYQSLKEAVIQNIPKESKEFRPLFSILLYFIKMLRELRFLRKFIDWFLDSPEWQGRPERLGISGLTKKDEENYERVLEEFWENYVYPKTSFFVLTFSFLVLQYFDKRQLTVDINRLKKFYTFANEYYKGIRELAKNVIEHSTYKHGVILSRVYDRDKIDFLNKPCFEGYKKGIESIKDIEKFFEVIILDDGEKGIIAKTIKNLEGLKPQFKNKDYVSYIKIKKDLKNLNGGKFKLSHFFKPEFNNSEHFLKHQEIRAAASLGLLIFYQVLRKNKGYVYVSTIKKDGNGSESVTLYHDNKKEDSGIFSKGTYYHILLPIPKQGRKEIIKTHSATIMFETPAGSEVFDALVKGEIDIDADIKARGDAKIKIIDYKLFQNDVFRQKIEKNPYIGKVITLNGDGFNDSSSLFRELASFQIERSFKSIVVYNIKEDVRDTLIDILKIYHQAGLKIWSNDHFTLLYTKNNLIPLVLGGENQDEWCCLNEIVSKQFLSPNPFLEKIKDNKANEKNNSISAKLGINSNPLFWNGVLIPFEVIIPAEETLFEQIVVSYLKQKIEEGGFCFQDAHIRLGSKIHLTDFFYAERMFQNSYYALRFAYLIANYIASKENEWKQKLNTNSTITILGYGLYSQLLVSNVANFLKIKFDDKYEFNHTIIKDVEELTVLNEEKLTPHIILIVPIGSTLTTQIKIFNSIKNKNTESKFILEPITVIVVGHNKPTEVIKGGKNEKCKIVKHFWDKVYTTNKYIYLNKNMISNNGNIEKTHYLIYLPSEWHNPHHCPECYPENWWEEKALFETNKVSVTPQAIFSLPRGKVKDDNSFPITIINDEGVLKGKDEAAVIMPSMVKYGHYERGKNHYLFYIDTNKFFERNKEGIKDWLEKLKKKIITDFPDILSSRIILIAPAHDTNVDFVNLVNEVLFKNVAFTIHYHPKEDYRQNFSVFFETNLDKANKKTYFFFVDDALCTGITLRIADHLLKSLNTKGTNICACITMINRLSDKRDEVLKKELDNKIYSFTNLEVPVIRDIEKPCHLCEEKKKYEEISSKSLVDALRWEVKCKEIKLKVKNISEENKDEKKCVMAQSNNSRYLERLKTTHVLFSEFRENNKLREFFAEKNNKNCDLENLLNVLPDEFSHNKEYKFHILKILSTPYFVYYKEIRKKIFRILLSELKNALERKNISDIPYGIMLIKRLAYLNSASLIRKDILTGIKAWIEKTEKFYKEFYKEIKDLKKQKEKLEKEITKHTKHDASTDIEIIDLIIQSIQTGNKQIWEKISKKLGISTTKTSKVEQGLTFLTPLPQEECQREIKKHSSELYEKINDLLKNFETKYQNLSKKIKKDKLTFQDLEEMSENAKRFNVIYAQAVKEIIYKDEAKSLRLEYELDQLGNDSNKKTAFEDLVNFLRIENVTIFQNALKFFLDKIYNSNIKIRLFGNIEKDLQELEQKVNVKEEIKKHYKLLYLRYLINYFLKKNFKKENFENLTDEIKNLEENDFYRKKFLPALLLALFLKEKTYEKKEEEIIEDNFNNIEERVNYILKLLCKIVDIDDDNNGGAFLVINRKIGREDKEIEPYIIGAIGKDKEKVDRIDLQNQNSWTLKVFEGIKSGNLWKGRPWTNIERYEGDEKDIRDKFKNWVKFDELPEKKVLSDAKYFLFLRITKLEEKENKPVLNKQGVIVFYKTNLEKISPKDYRYLLILRNNLSEFLQKHYENYSFLEWINERNMSEFYREIAHDLKTPLTCLREVLNSSENDKEIIINKIIKDIDDLLSLIKLGARKKKLEVKKIWLLSLLKKVEETREDVNFKFNISVPNGVYIMGDEQYLKRVFNNLIQNAKEAGATEVEIQLKNKQLVIRNNGEEISADIKEKIFKKEFSTKPNGSGLGLYIAQKILSFYNAKLELTQTKPVAFSIWFKEVHFEKD